MFIKIVLICVISILLIFSILFVFLKSAFALKERSLPDNEGTASNYLIRTVKINGKFREYKQILKQLKANHVILQSWGFKTVYVMEGNDQKKKWNGLFLYELPKKMSQAEFENKEMALMDEKGLKSWMKEERTEMVSVLPDCFLIHKSLSGSIAFNVEYIHVKRDSKEEYFQTMTDVTSRAM